MGAGDEHADIEALRLTRDESRAVLDHHLTLLNDLDDKAMWTIRTAILVLTLIASATAVLDSTVLAQLPPAAVVSFSLAIIGLFVTIFVGHGASVVSATKFGPGSSYRQAIRADPYSEREWLVVLPDGYDDWIQQMDLTNDENARLVFWAQGLLAASLALLVVGTSLLITGG